MAEKSEAYEKLESEKKASSMAEVEAVSWRIQYVENMCVIASAASSWYQ